MLNFLLLLHLVLVVRMTGLIADSIKTATMLLLLVVLVVVLAHVAPFRPNNPQKLLL
jgi:hypothetical protein